MSVPLDKNIIATLGGYASLLDRDGAGIRAQEVRKLAREHDIELRTLREACDGNFYARAMREIKAELDVQGELSIVLAAISTLRERVAELEQSKMRVVQESVICIGELEDACAQRNALREALEDINVWLALIEHHMFSARVASAISRIRMRTDQALSATPRGEGADPYDGVTDTLPAPTEGDQVFLAESVDVDLPIGDIDNIPADALRLEEGFLGTFTLDSDSGDPSVGMPGYAHWAVVPSNALIHVLQTYAADQRTLEAVRDRAIEFDVRSGQFARDPAICAQKFTQEILALIDGQPGEREEGGDDNHA